MKRKVCVKSMMLGAGIMLIGLAVGTIVSPPLIAQHNGVFDKVVCRKLEERGNKAIGLQSKNKSNSVSVYDGQGNVATVLGSIDELGSSLNLYNKQEQLAVGLSSIEEGNGLSIYDRQGKVAIELGSQESGNKVVVFDQHGKPATEMVSDGWGNWVRVRYCLQPDFPAAQLASIGVQNFVNVYNRGEDQTAAGLFSNDFTGNLVAVYERKTGKVTALEDR